MILAQPEEASVPTDTQPLNLISREEAERLFRQFFGPYSAGLLMLDLDRSLIGNRRIRFAARFHLIESTPEHPTRRVRVILVPLHADTAQAEEYRVALTKDSWRFARFVDRDVIRFVEKPSDRFLATRFETVR
jgi:hypothetical protein